MTKKLKVSLAFVVGGALGLAAGCQTYDFEPVQPLAIAKTTQAKKVVARNAKPDMMMLIDKSGSMSFTDPGQSQTRIQQLKSAMNTFLTGAGATVARLGLAVFPNATSTNACLQGGIVKDVVQSDVDADLQAQSATINQYIQNNITPNGGTPTAASLAVVGNATSLNGADRDDFILLETDGLPNCDSSLNASTCTCSDPSIPAGCNGDGRQCLDDAATVQQITNLRGRGIRTIVVGFGADTGTGTAAGTLNAMAAAGGMARTCKKLDGTIDPSLCGSGDTCDAATNECGIKFYKAADSAQLVAALQAISVIVGTGDPCVYTLDSKPSDPRFLTVTIDGQNVASAPDTWTYDATTNKVTFVQSGTICPKILNATPNAPVNVEFGIVESL